MICIRQLPLAILEHIEIAGTGISVLKAILAISSYVIQGKGHMYYD